MMSQATAHQISATPVNSNSFLGLSRPAALTLALAFGLLGASVMGDAIAAAVLPNLASELGSQSTGGGVVLVALAQAIVLAPIAIYSRASGLRLAACISGAFWLITWLLIVTEAVVYLGPILPDGFAVWTGISQGLVSLAAGPMAVVLFRDGSASAAQAPRHPPLLDSGVTPAAWVLRLGGVSLVYLVAYITAGVFIAFSNPALQEYYEAIGIPGPSTLISLQVGRAILWALAAALLLSVLDVRRRTAALMVGIVFSVTMAAPVLTPNPFLPAEIQSTHFVEIATSNFVFGFAAAWILTRASHRTRRGQPGDGTVSSTVTTPTDAG